MKTHHLMVDFHGKIKSMIDRILIKKSVRAALKRSRIVALIGPRQCGKTTIARTFVPADSLNYFDLEDPASLSRLEEPMTALQDLKGTIVIDEIQRTPNLFPVLRVLADRVPLRARFLILGSASPGLLQHSSESLAGRLEIIEIKGFSLHEIGFTRQQNHWLRGGFPLSFLARTHSDSTVWRKNFIKTVSERDLSLLGYKTPSTTILRFWTMLAHYHAQNWSAAEPARSLGVGESSVRRYLDLLTDVFMIRQLQPWHANLKKRQVKSPRIYFRDSGLLHQLLGIRTKKELLENPKCGASWEGYVLEELLDLIKPDEAYFWSTHNGAELDLFIIKDGKRAGIEIKRSDAPQITSSMRIALKDLELPDLYVIYPGEKTYPLSNRVKAVAFREAVPFFKKLFL